MRKVTVLILTCIIVLSCFSACSNSNLPKKIPLYKSLIGDVTMGDIEVEKEYDFSYEMFWKTDVPDKEYVYDSKTYDMKYHMSEKETVLSFVTDTYLTEDKIRFSFREDTGELVNVSFMNESFFDRQKTLKDIENSEEFAMEYSKEIAKKYIGNIDEYTQILGNTSELKGETNSGENIIKFYTISFRKFLQGYETTDYISIKITSKGTLGSISIGEIGAFDDLNIEIDEDRLNQSVSMKLDELCKNLGYTLVDKTFDYRRMHLVPNGDVCIYTLVSITFCDSNGNERSTALCIETCVAKVKM